VLYRLLGCGPIENLSWHFWFKTLIVWVDCFIVQNSKLKSTLSKVSGMERHYSYSVPIRDDSLRQLHFIRSTGTGSKVDQKMLPIQKHKKIVKNAAQDDERDDAFVASKRRNGYGWDNSDPRKHASSNERLALMGGRRSRERHFISPRSQGLPAWQQSTTWRNVRSYDWQGRSHRSPGMVPISQIVQKSSRSTHHLPTLYHASEDSMRMKYESEKPTRFPSVSYPPQQVSTSSTRTRSKVIIPNSLVLPKSLISSSTMREPRSSQDSIVKRAAEPNGFSPPLKRAKRVLQPLEGHFDKLALLCKATLDLGPLLDNPAGCSCPKSKCIALYCDCFKAGRRCSPACSCLDCKNTVEESGPNGARSKVRRNLHFEILWHQSIGSILKESFVFYLGDSIHPRPKPSGFHKCRK
jgi:hypothetical protein